MYAVLGETACPTCVPRIVAVVLGTTLTAWKGVGSTGRSILKRMRPPPLAPNPHWVRFVNRRSSALMGRQFGFEL